MMLDPKKYNRRWMYSPKHLNTGNGTGVTTALLKPREKSNDFSSKSLSGMIMSLIWTSILLSLMIYLTKKGKKGKK